MHRPGHGPAAAGRAGGGTSLPAAAMASCFPRTAGAVATCAVALAATLGLLLLLGHIAISKRPATSVPADDGTAAAAAAVAATAEAASPVVTASQLARLQAAKGWGLVESTLGGAVVDMALPGRRDAAWREAMRVRQAWVGTVSQRRNGMCRQPHDDDVAGVAGHVPAGGQNPVVDSSASCHHGAHCGHLLCTAVLHTATDCPQTMVAHLLRHRGLAASLQECVHTYMRFSHKPRHVPSPVRDGMLLLHCTSCLFLAQKHSRCPLPPPRS